MLDSIIERRIKVTNLLVLGSDDLLSIRRFVVSPKDTTIYLAFFPFRRLIKRRFIKHWTVRGRLKRPLN